MIEHIQINDVVPRIAYVADGVQAAFTFPFAIFKAADLEVWLGAIRQSGGFTVSGAGIATGGTCLFAQPPVAGTRVTLRRRMALERVTDYQADGIIRAKTLNDELDYQVSAVQQVAEETARSIRRSPFSASAADLTLPEPDAGKAIGWNDAGTGLVNDPSHFAEIRATVLAQAAQVAADRAVVAAGTAAVAADRAGTATLAGQVSTDRAVVAADQARVAGLAAQVAADRVATNSDRNAAVAAAASAQAYRDQAATGSGDALAYANAAAAAQNAAEAARDATLTAYDNFDDRYLGAKAVPPSLDNDGNALVAGALYFDTSSQAMKLWHGAAWVAAYVSGSGYMASSNNLSDVASTAQARANLGLGPLATLNPGGTPNGRRFLRDDGSWQSAATLDMNPLVNALHDMGNAETRRYLVGGFVDSFNDTTGVASVVGLGYEAASKRWVNTDPYAAYCRLLLHFDGNLTDSSPVGNVIGVTNGPMAYDTSDPKFGSGAFQGNMARCLYANNPIFQVGTGDYTFQVWIKPAATQQGFIIDSRTANSTNAGGMIYFKGGGVITLSGGLTEYLNSPAVFTSGSWQHLCVERHGGATTVYRNGVAVASGNPSYSFTDTGAGIFASNVGGGFQGYNPCTGDFDDLCIHTGVALYKGAFTPPSLPVGSAVSGYLRSVAYAATQRPAVIYGLIRYQDVASAGIALGSELTARATIDGTHWVTGTLTAAGRYDDVSLLAVAEFDVSGQNGTAVQVEAAYATGKSLYIHDLGARWGQ